MYVRENQSQRAHGNLIAVRVLRLGPAEREPGELPGLPPLLLSLLLVAGHFLLLLARGRARGTLVFSPASCRRAVR